MKKLSAVLLILAMIFALCSCIGEKPDPATLTIPSEEREVKTKVAVLNGPTGMGLIKVKNDRSYGYDVELYNDPQEIVPLLVNGEIDIAALPLNLAANLYQKTNGGIQILAISTLGVLHVLEKGESVKSIEDLKGKTVYATGQGATPEYIINYILGKNGINPAEDLTIEYKSAHPELATLAIEGNADICILPEPFASKVVAANPEYRNALDLTEEWSKVSETQLAMGCIVARKDYIDANPEIISEFMTFAQVSSNFISHDIAAGVYLTNNGFFDDPEVADATIPGCNIVFISGEEMKAIAQDNFKVLYDADPASVGGEIPDDNFYCLNW